MCPGENIFRSSIEVSCNYHRYLHAGVYSITYRAGNYEPVVIDNVVVGNDSTTIVNVQLDSLVGIEDDEKLQNEVHIYPNPVKDVLNVLLPQMAREVILTNATGQIVLRSISGEREIQLDISNLQSGIYLMQIDFDHHQVSKKIIIF